MVSKSYRFQCYPTVAQARRLAVEFDCARYVWNRALATRKEAWKARKESLNYVALSAMLTEWKRTDAPFLKEVTATCHTQKLIKLDRAYKNFFKKRAGFPRFKRKHDTQSIRYQLDQRRAAKNFKAGEPLKLPKLGALNLVWSQAGRRRYAQDGHGLPQCSWPLLRQFQLRG